MKENIKKATCGDYAEVCCNSCMGLIFLYCCCPCIIFCSLRKKSDNNQYGNLGQTKF